MKTTLKRSLIAIALSSALASCAVVPPNSGENPNDPWETFNRQTHAFNMTMDEYVLHPIAQSYADYVPTPVQDGVSNFFSNLGEPGNMLNNFLQGKFKEGAVSFARFLINSTVGIAGLFDVASHMNLEYAPEDFGETLGTWGVGPGPTLFGHSWDRVLLEIPPLFLWIGLRIRRHIFSGIEVNAIRMLWAWVL